MLRLLGTIGGYIWTYRTVNAERRAHIDVHLYIGAKLGFDCGGDMIELEQETQWPSAGDVKFRLRSQKVKVDLRLRIPGWAESWKVSQECRYYTLDNKLMMQDLARMSRSCGEQRLCCNLFGLARTTS